MQAKRFRGIHRYDDIIPPMADPTRPEPPSHSASAPPRRDDATPPSVTTSTNGTPCDRCGTDMFRMHAVWRCPNCGYKTDCCGW
jgi:hypothetical protein